MRKIKRRLPDFSKKPYRYFTIKEAKQEFSNDVKEYIEWEIDVLLYGYKIMGDKEHTIIVEKYKKQIVDEILLKDDEVVQESMVKVIEKYLEIDSETLN